MKRLAIIAALLCAAFSFAYAQDNPYGIDDTCYEYFKMAEALVPDTTNDAFDIANDALLKRAQEVGDEKARTLHYVCRLKRAIRFARQSDNVMEANESVEHQRKETQKVARETGYLQYYYYAYTITQTYYVNTRQEIHAQKLIGEMMDIAAKEQNEFGIWQSNIFLSQLFMRQNDLNNTRRHLLRAAKVYENSSDPVIRKQSFTRQFCDLANTYPTGSDSARYYYKRAEETALIRGDTLRVMFSKAQLAAYDRQLDKYRRHRDFCLKDDYLESVIAGAAEMFECADAILDNVPLKTLEPIAAKVRSRYHLLYLRDLAIKYQHEDAAAELGSIIILTLYNDISSINDMKIEEMTALMNDRQLNMKLENQRKLITLLWILIGVLTVVSLTLAAFILTRKNNQ